MKLKIRNKLERLYKGTWFITLFATTIGVLLAFYLNNLNEHIKTDSLKQVSLKSIHDELIHNESRLLDTTANDQLIKFLKAVKAIDAHIPTELTTSIGEMSVLKTSYADFIKIVDSVLIEKEIFKYSMSYKFELNLDDLRSIAWETSKLSEVIRELKYECVQALVKIYSLQEIYASEQQKTLNYFVEVNHKKLLNEMLIVKQLRTQLLVAIKEGIEEIKNCN